MAKILVIDDSSDFCTLMGTVLERAGHEAIHAYNGADGIEAAASDQPDMILLDYMMPGMNGREVFHKLREDEGTRQIPVIMITAFSTDYDADRESALRLGMDDYVTKPVSPKALVDRIADLLYLRRYSPRPLRDDPGTEPHI